MKSYWSKRNNIGIYLSKEKSENFAEREVGGVKGYVT